MKIVINKCWGGFGLSKSGFKRYLEYSKKDYYFYSFKNDLGEDLFKKTDYSSIEKNDTTIFSKDFGKYFTYDPKIHAGYEISVYGMKRNDPALVRVVEDMGKASWGTHSQLKVVEVPDDVIWEIDDYDGMETVEEVSRSWD